MRRSGKSGSSTEDNSTVELSGTESFDLENGTIKGEVYTNHHGAGRGGIENLMHIQRLLDTLN